MQPGSHSPGTESALDSHADDVELVDHCLLVAGMILDVQIQLVLLDQLARYYCPKEHVGLDFFADVVLCDGCGIRPVDCGVRHFLHDIPP